MGMVARQSVRQTAGSNAASEAANPYALMVDPSPPASPTNGAGGKARNKPTSPSGSARAYATFQHNVASDANGGGGGARAGGGGGGGGRSWALPDSRASRAGLKTGSPGRSEPRPATAGVRRVTATGPTTAAAAAAAAKGGARARPATAVGGGAYGTVKASSSSSSSSRRRIEELYLEGTPALHVTHMTRRC